MPVRVCMCVSMLLLSKRKKDEKPISTVACFPFGCSHRVPLYAVQFVHCENIFKMYFAQPCVPFMFIFIPFENAENCSYMHKYSANSSVNAHTLWTMAHGLGLVECPCPHYYPDNRKINSLDDLKRVPKKYNTVGSQWTRWEI